MQGQKQLQRGCKGLFSSQNKSSKAKLPSRRRQNVRVLASQSNVGSDRQHRAGLKSQPFSSRNNLPCLHHSKDKMNVAVQGASGYGADDINAKIKNRKPPGFIAKLLAAFFYVVPWLDILQLGAEYHRRFVTTVIFLVIPDPLWPIYYGSQFAPLIVFFLLFLSVVKNFRLHHFTRFHCMQAIVLDIVVMLFTLVRQYFPAEIRWSPVLGIYDMFAYNMCICTIVYCIFFALAGQYANIPYVSESTYMQVEEGP